MVDTPDVQFTDQWTEAQFGLRLDPQSRHRSDGTITNRLCSSTIMAKHAIAAGLAGPADVTYTWLAGYLSTQYAGRSLLALRGPESVLGLVQRRVQVRQPDGEDPPPGRGREPRSRC